MEKSNRESGNFQKIKAEPEEITFGHSSKNVNLDAWSNLPIPFKVEPDVDEDRSTEKYLDHVSAVVNANIAQIGEDLVDMNNKQLMEVRLQMEALQKTLLGQRFKENKFRTRFRGKNKPEEDEEEIDDSENLQNSNCDTENDDLPKCAVCKRVFNDDDSLLEHINNRPLLQCCACSKIFRDNSQLNIHFRKHTGEKPYACKECDKKFSIKGNLHKHLRTHTGERRFECKICTKRFMQFAHLDDHIKTHTGERPFSCDECYSAFKTKALLKKHKRNHDEKTIRKRCVRCRICGKVMKTSKQLYGHMKLHSEDEEPFKCEVCGKVYKTLFYLQGHQKMHKGIRPYKCSICDKSFVISSQLRRHENSHAGLKPFECDICSRPFGVFQNLKRHLLTHTGDKPYSCKTCGKSFLTFENMNRHTRIHTGEKPFGCDICGRKFAHSTTVKEHRRTHTGDKPYGCSICNKRFTLNKGLYKHMRMRHVEFYDTFVKVGDIPRQVRLQVAHNFDKDEYQQPEYIKSSDIATNGVKMEPVDDDDDDYDEEDIKPLIYTRYKCHSSQFKETVVIPNVIKAEQTEDLAYANNEAFTEERKPQLEELKMYLKEEDSGT